MFAVDPRVRWRLIALQMIAAVTIPWLLELAGVWPRTMAAVDGALVLRSDVMTIRLPQLEVGLLFYVVTLVTMMAFVAHRVGTTTRAALRAVELQAWHLRQLVPAKR